MSIHPSGLWKPKSKFAICTLAGKVDATQIRVSSSSIEGRWAEVQFHKGFDINLVPRFLNCGSTVEILKFTKRYGPLITKPYYHPELKLWTQRPWDNTDWKFELQDEHGNFPGAYVFYHLMTWIPGRKLCEPGFNFWNLPWEKRDKIRRAFRIALTFALPPFCNEAR